MSVGQMLDNIVRQYGLESDFAVNFAVAMANGADKKMLNSLYEEATNFRFEEEKEG